MLLLMISVPSFLFGQTESGDSTSKNVVPEVTVIVENVVKTPELQVEKTPENVFPAAAPMIPMNIPGMHSFDHLMPPRYLGYEGIMNMYRYTDLKYDAKTLNLNLNLPPAKNILDLIRENPLRALMYSAATLAGMVNHTVMGEDKMNLIRLDNMVQSRSGIPETAISGNGTIYYEIDIKRKK
jgi:hypothetical protein